MVHPYQVKFVCTLIFGFFLVDRFGRRLPLMAGSIGLSCCLFFLGGYVSAILPFPRLTGIKLLPL
jgi:MFS family permease